MRTALIAGNWKMNGLQADATSLARAVVSAIEPQPSVEVLVCPPFVHLAPVGEALKDSGVRLGAQNCADVPQGARTGEIAADMLADLQVQYVILGHSERREFYAEDNRLIASRCEQAVAAGLRPILCVGETLEARDAGQTEAVIAEQLDGVLGILGAEGFVDGVIAYEPVWAIGTGRTATTEQAQAVHAFIRNRLAAYDADFAERTRILYGGSMKPDNAVALLAQPDVDGGLIGGASLKAEDFAAIHAAAARG